MNLSIGSMNSFSTLPFLTWVLNSYESHLMTGAGVMIDLKINKGLHLLLESADPV
ncbi:hypothetical protein [Halobacillus litoralis]|uniref:hypothetical protein n=1 Tax=Halobacillus litoralis TaxID=45668 RepID=UPI001CFCCF27|nr:hypothetical protein [Halobacillus litoralis]